MYDRRFLVAVGVHVRPWSESLIQCRGRHLEPSGSWAVLSAVCWESHFKIMSDAKLNKARLRSTLRQRRQALGADIQRLAAQALTDFVVGIPDWPGAQRIALYLAADGEIDPGPLGALAHTQGKQLFLPVIKPDNSLSFAAWLTQDSLLVNRYGIPEPPAHARRCPATDLDIIFLPLVGWDARGGRLGMGGGFYDRSLSGVTGPLLVGLAHSSQQVDRIPRDNWDISLDFIATEASLHCCQE